MRVDITTSTPFTPYNNCTLSTLNYVRNILLDREILNIITGSVRGACRPSAGGTRPRPCSSRRRWSRGRGPRCRPWSGSCRPAERWRTVPSHCPAVQMVRRWSISTHVLRWNLDSPSSGSWLWSSRRPRRTGRCRAWGPRQGSCRTELVRGTGPQGRREPEPEHNNSCIPLSRSCRRLALNMIIVMQCCDWGLRGELLHFILMIQSSRGRSESTANRLQGLQSQQRSRHQPDLATLTFSPSHLLLLLAEHDGDQCQACPRVVQTNPPSCDSLICWEWRALEIIWENIRAVDQRKVRPHR